MGWWTQNEEGVSFATAEGAEMIWGDGPADIMANAVDEIVAEFQAHTSRAPTKAEIAAGLKFHLAARDELS